MLIEELSNHPGAQVLTTESAIARERHDRAQHLRAVDDLRREHRASRRWWQWAKRMRQSRELQALRANTPVIDSGKTHRLAQQRAGVAAEDRVAFELDCLLPSDWTLFRGYANRRGEVDLVLVGERGVWAIEVKGQGLRVHISGDDWWFEKFDRYGNLVDQGSLVDRRGRSWGRQVGDIANDLHTFLGSRGVAVAVRTAVVIMHDRAELGARDDLHVDAVSVGTDHLIQRVLDGSDALDHGTANKIADLVRRDHAFHARRRQQRHH